MKYRHNLKHDLLQKSQLAQLACEQGILQ
jgi:hypothetical protein